MLTRKEYSFPLCLKLVAGELQKAGSTEPRSLSADFHRASSIEISFLGLDAARAILISPIHFNISRIHVHYFANISLRDFCTIIQLI